MADNFFVRWARHPKTRAFFRRLVGWRLVALALASFLLIAPWSERQALGECTQLIEDGQEARALPYCRQAAEKGSLFGTMSLAALYGAGPAENKREAVKWALVAAKRGDPIMQSLVAISYFTGDGVPQDRSEAAKWFLRAAKQRDAKSRYILGKMYYNGEGVPEDKQKGAHWLRLAAEQGHVKAQLALSALYKKGEGVPHSERDSFIWLSLAATRIDMAEEIESAKKALSVADYQLALQQIATRREEIAEKKNSIFYNLWFFSFLHIGLDTFMLDWVYPTFLAD